MKTTTPYNRALNNHPVAIAVAVDNSGSLSRVFIAGLVLLFLLLGVLTGNAKRPHRISTADIVGKVYGVANPCQDKATCREIARQTYGSSPVEDDGAEWIGETEGFAIDYEGQYPESEAMARYENDKVAGYGYIFYFPYKATEREKANKEQCRFCTTLIDELNEMGAIVGANPLTDALFDVGGYYNGGDVQLTLSEYIESETRSPELQAGAIPSDRSGQFVVIVSVVPAERNEFTAVLE